MKFFFHDSVQILDFSPLESILGPFFCIYPPVFNKPRLPDDLYQNSSNGKHQRAAGSGNDLRERKQFHSVGTAEYRYVSVVHMPAAMADSNG